MLLTLLACNEIAPWETGGGGVVPEGPRVVASPGQLDFGAVSAGSAGAGLTLTLYNLGDEAATVSGHDEPMGSSAFTVEADPLVVLEPGFQLDLLVRYEPTTEQTDAAELLIDPNDEVVRLTGNGTAPVLVLGDVSADPVVVGCSGGIVLPLSNTGSETLVLDDVQATDDEFEILDFPSSVEPGGAGEITLTFTPAGGGLRGTTVQIYSNDPLFPLLGSTLSGLGYEGERVTETFRYSPSNPTDLLFLIKTSGGMTAQLDKAADVVEEFVDALRDANIDYHLAGLSGAGPCPDVGPAWAERTDTSLQTEAILDHAIAGGSGAWDDQLLTLATAALEQSEEGGCLAGFRRADADLHLVILADGPATDDPLVAVETIEATLTSPAELLLSALLPESDCGETATNYEIALETNGGTVWDLCDGDWSAAFQGLTELPPGRDTVHYPLAEVPVPSTIAVAVEGITFEDWSWDKAENAVVFDGDAAPALGAEVTVTYVSSVSCD